MRRKIELHRMTVGGLLACLGGFTNEQPTGGKMARGDFLRKVIAHKRDRSWKELARAFGVDDCRILMTIAYQDRKKQARDANANC